MFTVQCSRNARNAQGRCFTPQWWANQSYQASVTVPDLGRIESHNDSNTRLRLPPRTYPLPPQRTYATSTDPQCPFTQMIPTTPGPEDDRLPRPRLPATGAVPRHSGESCQVNAKFCRGLLPMSGCSLFRALHGWSRLGPFEGLGTPVRCFVLIPRMPTQTSMQTATSKSPKPQPHLNTNTSHPPALSAQS